jgi:hypothetical protein
VPGGPPVPAAGHTPEENALPTNRVRILIQFEDNEPVSVGEFAIDPANKDIDLATALYALAAEFDHRANSH